MPDIQMKHAGEKNKTSFQEVMCIQLYFTENINTNNQQHKAPKYM